MVEGPGCKLKGIKIKAKLKNQRVKGVKGNAVDKVSISVGTGFGLLICFRCLNNIEIYMYILQS